jgi:hypothetical protein
MTPAAYTMAGSPTVQERMRSCQRPRPRNRKRGVAVAPSGDRFGPAHPLTFAEVEQASCRPRARWSPGPRGRRAGTAERVGQLVELVYPRIDTNGSLREARVTPAQ